MSGSFTIQLTEQVMQDFTILHTRRQKWRWLAIMAASAVVLILLFGRDDAATGNAPPSWTPILVVILLFVVGFVLLAGLIKILNRIWTRRYYRQQVSLHHPVSVAWDEDGIVLTTQADQSRRNWTDYVAWQTDDRLLAIYQSFTFANVIPITDDTREHVAGMIAALQRAGVRRRSRI